MHDQAKSIKARYHAIGALPMCIAFARDMWCERSGCLRSGTLPRVNGASQVVAVSVSPVDDRAGIFLRSQYPEYLAEAYQRMVCLAPCCKERPILEAPSAVARDILVRPKVAPHMPPRPHKQA